eukprot:TRINITY_DN951_c0_g2_i3.p1 TRINITY_DN951_c0_g2~~TRINITY_DN951_c0_g2_i3.p1  ORF type:complete len:691 (-),score=230.10 TRINITY_DN951_c0_g2_i3:187-2175(-)
MSLSKFMPSPFKLALAGGAAFLAYRYFAGGPQYDPSLGGRFEDLVEAPPEALFTNTKKKVERFVFPGSSVVPVLIFYGTEYGLSREVAVKIEEKVNSIDGLWGRVVDMEEHDMLEMDREQIVLIVTSTYGDGVPPTTARPYYDLIGADVMADPADGAGLVDDAAKIYSHLKYSVLALGDSAYPYFCRAGRTMDRRFEQLGAQRIMPIVEVDQEDWAVMDAWIEKVGSHVAGLKASAVPRDDDYLHEKALVASASNGFGRKRPYYARLGVKSLLTKINGTGSEDKETIHFEFELGDSGLTFTVGDALALQPTNCPDEVRALLKLMAPLVSSGSADQHKIGTPSWHYIEDGQEDRPAKMALGDALSKCYDIHNLKPELLQLIKDKTKDSKHRQFLESLLAAGTGKTNQPLQDYLYNHHLVDALQQFKNTISHLRLDDVLSRVSRLLPRYYSISSSLKHSPTTVSVTIAVVRYTLHSTVRKGVTSTMLADRIKEGDRVPIFVNPNPDFRLPASADTPIIMVGPGTGLAPFRAFIQEREALGALTDPALNVLYFGCRHKEKDFLYKEALERLHEERKIELITAFSRDQQKKVYVQNRIAENAEAVWRTLSAGGHIYICGDAAHMAGDVHQALVYIAHTHGSMSEHDAAHFLEKMEKDKRYQKDVWF